MFRGDNYIHKQSMKLDATGYMLVKTIWTALPLLRFSQIRRDIMSTAEKTPDSYRFTISFLRNCRNCSWWDYASSVTLWNKEQTPSSQFYCFDACCHLKSAGMTSTLNIFYCQGTMLPIQINICVFPGYMCKCMYRYCTIAPTSTLLWIFTDVYHCEILAIVKIF